MKSDSAPDGANGVVMKISIMLPAYNEKGNAEELARRLRSTMRKLKIKFEIVYIIQGNDGTYESLAKLKKQILEMRLFHYPQPLGAGGAFKEGFSKINDKFDYVLTMDADLNHHPEEFVRFLEALKKTNCDIIIGSRKVQGGENDLPFVKQLVSNFTNFLLPKIFMLPAKDITSGYRLFKMKVVKTVREEITSRNFEVYAELLIRARRHGFTMTEVPITYTRRQTGKSKFNLFRSGMGYLKLLFS